MVEHVLGAQPPTERHLLRAAGGAQHPCTERGEELDGEGADAAGGAVHEHPVPGLHARTAHERRVHRAGDLRQGRRLDEADAVGDGHELACRHGDVLGEAAAGQERAHPVTDGEAPLTRHPGLGSQRRHGAGDLEPGDLGGAARRRIAALALRDVRAVETRGGHVHQHLARAGVRHGLVAHADDAVVAGTGESHGAHLCGDVHGGLLLWSGVEGPSSRAGAGLATGRPPGHGLEWVLDAAAHAVAVRPGMVVRAAEGAGLENRCAVTPCRGFESLTIRVHTTRGGGPDGPPPLVHLEATWM